MKHGLLLGCCLGFTLVESGVSVEPEGKKPLPFEVAGTTVTPHVPAATLRFHGGFSHAEGARIQLFIRNTAPVQADPAEAFHSHVVTFDGQEPQHWITEGEWAWHDTPAIWPDAETTTPPGALTVWSFNALRPQWGSGKQLKLGITDWERAQKQEFTVVLDPPRVWLSAVTFLSGSNAVQPDILMVHVANESDNPVQLTGLRLYFPGSNHTLRAFFPWPPLTSLALFPIGGVIAAKDKGCARVATGALPLTYTVLEASLADHQGKPFSLWASLRVKRESFDISGSWVPSPESSVPPLTREPFLKTLKRLYVNTARISLVPGYTDQTGPGGLYTRYPLKFFGALQPVVDWDTDALLPRIHAVELPGQPQLEGSEQERSPQEVWFALRPYAASRLPTTITLTDASSWNAYAGMSDFPHFAAYRVSAPAVDDWTQYDRWGKSRIGWGAPLETLGDLCRSLRDMSRPLPIACNAQSAYHGGVVMDGRKRTSPTPDELRVQTYHALSSRITSLYWFDLSLESLVKYRDTLKELTRIGREISLLEEFYLEGDAYRYQQLRRDTQLDWDIASIVSPRGALLFALDLDYVIDSSARVFEFKRPRDTHFEFVLPVYLRRPVDVFRIDADGAQGVNYSLTSTGVAIADKQSRVALYVATTHPELRNALERRRQALLSQEQSIDFDPAANNKDFDALKAIGK